MKAPLTKGDPEKIGPYRLIARLGSGGMGIVYLATKGTQSVALKVLNEEYRNNHHAKTRFLKEVENLGQISSAFVANVVASDTDVEFCWLAVEFINAPDLKDRIEDKGPLSESEWATLAHGLLRGLAAIHSRGLIHRDIKPGNVLIADSGPKIIDFGISQDVDATSLTMAGSVVGSPAWLSPEQIDGLELTSASDLFSAGALLIYAATGRLPWGEQSTTTSLVFNRILNKEPSLDGLSDMQRRIIEPLMRKPPAERPSAIASIKVLDEFRKNTTLKESPSQSLSESKPKQGLRPKKFQIRMLNRYLIMAGTLALLLVAVLGVAPYVLIHEGLEPPSSVEKQQTPTPATTSANMTLQIVVSKSSSQRNADDKHNALLGWSAKDLSAIFDICYTAGFIDKLESTGREIFLEAKVNGSWKKIKGLEVGNQKCSRSRTLTLTRKEIVNLAEIGTCLEIRMVEPEDPGYVGAKPVNLCLILNNA